MNKRQAMHTFAFNHRGVMQYDIEGTGSISYTTGIGKSLQALRIEGDIGTVNGVYTPVGIATEDGAVIKLRIHGETLLDGHELERIMKERGSPCYGGVVDDEHFLYIAKDDGGYTLIDRTDMYIPNGSMSVIGEAILYEALPVGKTATGMQIMTGGGGRAISFGGTEGAVSFSGHNGNNYYNYSLTHKAVESEFRYAINYDSLRIVQNGNMTESPYNGYTREMKLSAPLYRISSGEYGDVYDELDVISGVVTRRIEAARAGDCEIELLYYMDMLCFRVILPSAVGESSIDCEKFYPMDEYSFIECIDSFMISPDRQSLYLNLGGEITTIEDAREYIGDDCLFLYARESEITEQVTPPDISTESGTVAIEVCSMMPARIYATYRA